MKPCVAVLLAALSLAACARSRLIPPAPKAYFVDGAPVSAALQTAPDFSGVVMVGEKGETLFATAQGLADREAGRSLSLYDSWRWGSATKMATSILVLQEAERGSLSLERALAEQEHRFAKEAAGKATLRQLLQHTSAIANPDRGATDAAGADAMGICAAAPETAPGPHFSDDDCAHIALGRWLEARTGKTYRALVKERIAEPAAMRGADVSPGACEESVKGYSSAESAEPPVNPAAYGAAGALCGPPRAMQAFAAAAMAGKLLGQPMRAQMRRTDPAHGDAGLGVSSYAAAL